MSQLALSSSLEHLSYGSTTIIHILILSVQGLSLYVRDGPRTERVDRNHDFQVGVRDTISLKFNK